jgi:hypothetical protein
MQQKNHKILYQIYRKTRDIGEKSTDCVEVGISNRIFFRTWRTMITQTFSFYNTLKSNL